MTVIAVIGGTGFLGRHLVTQLKEAGYSPRVLSRRTGFDLLRPDPKDLAGVSAVVNLAGIKQECGAQTFRAVHVDAVRRLVETMKSTGVSRLIHISVVVAREDRRLPYHDTKWLGEQIIRSSDLNWTILRPGVIYGHGDDLLSHFKFMIRKFPIVPIVGNGSSPMRPVDVQDVASAIIGALQTPSGGRVFDVVAPERLSLREVVETVAAAMDVRVTILPMPVALMRLPAHVMETTMSRPLLTRAQLAMLEEGLDGNPSPLARDLGVMTNPFSVEHIRPLL